MCLSLPSPWLSFSCLLKWASDAYRFTPESCLRLIACWSWRWVISSIRQLLRRRFGGLSYESGTVLGIWGKQREMRGVVSCSIGADSYSMIPCDFSWRDIKRGVLLSTSARKEASETKDPTKVHLGKPMRLLQVPYRRMGDSKAAISPGSSLINVRTVLPMKSPTHRIDNSQKASL